MRVRTRSPEETVALGRQLATDWGGELSGGWVVSLIGPLGSGKTEFMRGVVEGLGGNPSDVKSPTYSIAREYNTRKGILIHVDLYRLSEERARGILASLTERQGSIWIEWADRAPDLAVDRSVTFQYGEKANEREISVRVR